VTRNSLAESPIGGVDAVSASDPSGATPRAEARTGDDERNGIDSTEGISPETRSDEAGQTSRRGAAAAVSIHRGGVVKSTDLSGDQDDCDDREQDPYDSRYRDFVSENDHSDDGRDDEVHCTERRDDGRRAAGEAEVHRNEADSGE